MPNFGIGDIVEVKGYGGWAKVLNMEVDGYTPQGHPKYLCTVRFGLDEGEPQTWYEGKRGKKVKNLHTFYASQLTNIDDENQRRLVEEEPQEKNTRGPKYTSEQSEARRKAELREIMIEMAILEKELNNE
jgi:hypothetical protein